MKKNSWVVVANAEKAKIYRAVRVGQLEELTAIEHPEKGMKAKDVVSDRPGRTFNRMGYTRHAYQPQTTLKMKKDNLFALELAELLNVAFKENKFSHLYLIAEPHFLGVMKKHLSNQLLKALDKCFAKDMVDQKPDLIWESCEIAP